MAEGGRSKARFEVLARMAGVKLREHLEPDKLPEGVLDTDDDKIAWYRFMAATRFYESEGYAESSNGLIYSGHIKNPASVSATLCLDLAATTREAPLEAQMLEEANRIAKEANQRMREANEIANEARVDAGKSHRSAVVSGIAALVSAGAAVAAIFIHFLTKK